MKEKIMAMAALLEDVPAAGEGRLEALCAAAETELRAALLEGVAPEDCEEAFVTAAAWMALASQAEGSLGDVESFSAGDLTVRTGSADRSGRLRAQAGRLMAPYLADEGFCFRSVMGG